VSTDTISACGIEPRQRKLVLHVWSRVMNRVCRVLFFLKYDRVERVRKHYYCRTN
jgi:hypothetical protein